MLSIIIVFVLTIFDPFGFESATNRQSAIIVYKVYAAMYPGRMRDNISVVLLDDETLQSWNEAWPPSHILHSEIISNILSFEPIALLIDISFVYPRQGDHFERTINAISQSKIPIFLVIAGSSTGAPTPARSELFSLANTAGTKLTLVSAEVADPQQPLYPLRTDDEFKPAALALYQAICSEVNGSNCSGMNNSGETSGKIPIDGQMEVVWGMRPAIFNCKRAQISPDSKERSGVIYLVGRMEWGALYSLYGRDCFRCTGVKLILSKYYITP
jgi:hypothetical protein